MGKKKPSKTSDIEDAPIRDRKLGQKDKRKVEVDNENKKDLQKKKNLDGKAIDKCKGTLEDATARVSKKLKTGAEKVFPMKNGTDIKKDLKKQSSDGKLGKKGKRKLEHGTTNVPKKRKSDKIVKSDLMKAKESLPPKEVETSSCDEDSSDSMPEPKTDASSSKRTQPNTSFAPKQNSIIVGNLAPSMDKDKLRQFLKVAGTIVRIRLPVFNDRTCMGTAQVEFSTPEAVNKACYLGGTILEGRAVSINFGHKRGAFNPDSCLFKKPDNLTSNTVLIKGFDAAYGEVQINRSLRNHFSSCGRITNTEIPTSNETGATEGPYSWNLATLFLC